MTPRIPRGWVITTERGEGVWCAEDGGNRWHPASPFAGPLDPACTYIRRTDPSVSADPNEALRLEDDVAALAAERKPDDSPDALPMVPGMMRTGGNVMVPLGSFTWRPWQGSVRLATNAGVDLGIDGRRPAEFAAAYTRAWEYTERRRAEIAEEVRRANEVVEVRLADDPPAPDLGEWPGKPDVPPEHCRDIEILTPHGAFRAYRSSRYGWCAYSADRNNCAPVDPRDVLAWRELPLAFVDEDGRVTGVTRG